MTSYLLITKNEKLFQNIFFVMLIGATMALITPGIEDRLGFPHYRYFQFFISHGLIVINFTVLLFVYNWQKNIRYRMLLHNFASLLVIALVLLVINIITGGNYMYLMAKPGEGTAFDLFGVWPWYLVNIFFFGIPVFFHLFYLPFFVRDYRRHKRALV
ncbi:TIGR02206 family membrane protein [Xianfuyuplasma coldseepsis]|uniref:TIGR02206 family membrane protein n=1 Tax=Candidatus Xianfuyuplasma coldseepsis TaxID=2782163 RepID=A0A7L7KRY1_9MOLU|nr:TIGR02206 family membrane protein [Xianfuyuplasma coldseepsis]